MTTSIPLAQCLRCPQRHSVFILSSPGEMDEHFDREHPGGAPIMGDDWDLLGWATVDPTDSERARANRAALYVALNSYRFEDPLREITVRLLRAMGPDEVQYVMASPDPMED